MGNMTQNSYIDIFKKNSIYRPVLPYTTNYNWLWSQWPVLEGEAAIETIKSCWSIDLVKLIETNGIDETILNGTWFVTITWSILKICTWDDVAWPGVQWSATGSQAKSTIVLLCFMLVISIVEHTCGCYPARLNFNLWLSDLHID